MCQRVTCKKCGLATWSGCGQHINQVLKGVPQNKRCQCAAGNPKTKSLLTTGFLGKLLGS